MPLTVFVAVSTIVLWLTWSICLPLTVWMTNRLYKKRHSVLLQKRAIGTAIFSCSLCVIWIFVGLPLSAMYPLLTPYVQLILLVAMSIFTPILTYGTLFTICVRFFMVYFYYNWSAITLSTHWIFHIRKSSKKENKSRARKIQQIQTLQRQHLALQHQLAEHEQQRQVQKQQQQKQLEDKNNNNDNKEDESKKEEKEKEIGNNQSPKKLMHLSPNIEQLRWVLEQHSFPEDIDFIHRHYQRTEDIRNSWFILNKFKYASTRKVLRIAFNIYTVAISVVIFISVMGAYGDTPWIIAQFSTNWMLLLFPSVGIAYFYRKTPKNIEDLFFVRKEMKQLVIVLSIIWIGFLCTFPLYVLTENIGVNFIYAMILTFQCVAFVYYQTHWVLRNLHQQQTTLNCDLFNTNIDYEPNPFLNLDRSSYKSTLSSNTGSPPFNNEMNVITEAQAEPVEEIEEETKQNCNNSEEKPRSPAISAIQDIIINMDSADYESEKFRILYHCLRSDKLIDDFTRYLCIEMSMELSFAFIELTQFRRLMERDAFFMRNVSKAQSTPHPFGYQNVTLPETISRSTIVHNKKYSRMAPSLRYRKIAKKLAEKYLENGSEFELNINEKTKQQVVAWIHIHCKDIRTPRKKKSQSSRQSSHRSSRSHRSTNVSVNASTNVYSSQSERSRNYSSSKTLLSDQTYYLFEHCRKEIYFLMSHSCHRFVQCRRKQARIDSMNENNDKNDSTA